ncbi:DUF2243 domain-containing protein [Natronoarchaeum mannanilyticum]|uniref:DUF2243 domain-containing protein n=1 Tax=Natronoarchaeum mannanilyticum TaxID=926360 RepID=A0AAV3T5D6_9EURY
MGDASTDSERAGRGAARPIVIAGVVLGIGFGGFFDGIVFHQLLQWHHMLSHHSNPAIAGDLRLNVFADGLFHAFAYLATAVGLALLVRAARRPNAVVTPRLLGGALVAGWGLFNLLEGLINHQLLGIHHVNPAGPGPTLLWDLAFLAWGAAFLLGGALIVSRSPAAGTASSGRPTPE